MYPCPRHDGTFWTASGQAAPVRDGRHQALAVLIGKWINEGHTAGTAEIPSVPILTSDVYEWAPGGFFVLPSAFGRVGNAYASTFYDSFGNVHRSRLEIEGDVIRWTGDRTRCAVTMTDDGMTQVACHESSTDGVSWSASMDVTPRKVA